MLFFIIFLIYLNNIYYIIFKNVIYGSTVQINKNKYKLPHYHMTEA